MDQTAGLIRHLPRWQKVGCAAGEVSLRKVTNPAAFRQFLRDSGMSWIPQIFSRDFLPGGSASNHIDSLHCSQSEVPVKYADRDLRLEARERRSACEVNWREKSLE